MKPPPWLMGFNRLFDLGRKMLLSLGVGWLLLCGFQNTRLFSASPKSSLMPRKALEAEALEPEVEALDRRPVSRSTPSPLVFDGIPMITETLIEAPCHAESWQPESSSWWTADALMLNLERSSNEVHAAWVEPRKEGGKEPGNGTNLGILHGAQLTCESPRSGTLTHTETTATLDVEDWRRSMSRPTRERLGPVPLLDDAVQVTVVRNLEWTLFVDRVQNPKTAIERLHPAMEKRGWSSKTPSRDKLRSVGPALEHLPRLMNRTTDFSGLGGVWVRDHALCLAVRNPEAPGQNVGQNTEENTEKNLVMIACRGDLAHLGGVR